jgi:histidinol-phosphatase (PHP family)
MPWFSYHSAHSGQFCRHAKGSLEAVVQRAVELGFSHYGLSEHCPRYRREDLFDDEADLTPADTERMFRDYTREALRLRDQYADRIELLVGFETERLPPDRWAETMRGLRAGAGFEYVIGSVHDVDGVCIDYAPEQTERVATEVGGREALQIRYFEALCDLVETLRPEVVGHIDLIRKFEGPGAQIAKAAWPSLERVREAAREAGAVLDVNSGAHRRGLSPVYPLPAILERARALGVGVTLGDDGHGAHDVGAGLDACMRAIADTRYREGHYLERVDGQPTLRAAPIEQVAPLA